MNWKLSYCVSVKDYSPFIRVWDSPNGGLHAYLVSFLDDGQDTAFQHIGVWTLVQFLEGGGEINYPVHSVIICSTSLTP
jgi:hypothetical protein